MSAVEFAWISADDPRMSDVHALRHEALFEPFGIPRDDRWDDAGGDRRHLIALTEGVVAGYASLLFDPNGTGHVRQVCVRPDLQRSGAGSALMLEVEAEGRRLGMPLLWLHARCIAEPFYHRLGWITVSDKPFPSGRTGIPHVRMEKVLSR